MTDTPPVSDMPRHATDQQPTEAIVDQAAHTPSPTSGAPPCPSPTSASKLQPRNRTAPRHARRRPRHGVVIVALLLTLDACADGNDADVVATTAPTVGVTSVGESTTSPPSSPPPSPETTSSMPATAVGEGDIESRRVEPLATIPLGAPPAKGLVAENAVWVATENQTLLRIDPVTNQIVQELAAPGLTGPFDIGLGAAWIPDFDASVLRRIDLASGAVTAEIPTGVNPAGVDVTTDAVWVADHRAGTVTRIDPAANLAVATVEVGAAGPAGPSQLVADGDRVWVGVPNAKQVVAIDTATNQVVDRIPAEMPCGEMQVIAGDLWVTSCFEDQFVDIIDTVRPLRRGSVETGGAAGGLLAANGLVWITTVQLELGQPGSFIGVNPYTGQIVERLTVDDPAYTAAIGFDSVWMFAWEAQAVVRLPLKALRRDG